MQEFLVVSAILSWTVIILNLLISLATVRHLREIKKSNEPELLEVGTRAPDFSLETLDGKTATLSNYENQERLMIFVSPHCGPCRAEMPNLKQLSTRIEADGICFLLVSLGEKDATQAFIDEFQMQSTVLITEHTSPFTGEYKISATPAYYWIDKQGQIKERGYFDNKWQKIIKHWAN